MPDETCRYDLDDLGGEVVLIDWSSNHPKMKVFQESKANNEKQRTRKVHLEDNPLLLPLTDDTSDPIGNDIATIPKALEHIQAEKVGLLSCPRLC